MINGQNNDKRTLTLMGSGEMTSSMVKVHGEILDRIEERPVKALFLDTPAGFQLNADLLSEKAKDYFETHFRVKMEPVLFKKFSKATPLETEEAAHKIMNSHFIFAGPGSPTYALNNWLKNAVGNAIKRTTLSNGHLVFASAASICTGRYSIPVYEIYKVGQAPFWVGGLDLLGEIGLDLAVIPHWNNTEGGNHDTRFCYMGEPRLKILVNQLPRSTTILGLDEHTACIIDLNKGECFVKGAGSVTVLKNGREKAYPNGSAFRLHELYPLKEREKTTGDTTSQRPTDSSLLSKITEIEKEFLGTSINTNDIASVLHIPMDLFKTIQNAKGGGEPYDNLFTAYDRLFHMQMKLAENVTDVFRRDKHILTSLIEEFVAMRNELRQKKEWGLADRIREELGKLGIILEDHKEETRWNRTSS